jgi:hypothetical protein
LGWRITVEVPEDLCRRAKAEAALRGRKLRELVEEGYGSYSMGRAKPVRIRVWPD